MCGIAGMMSLNSPHRPRAHIHADLEPVPLRDAAEERYSSRSLQQLRIQPGNQILLCLNRSIGVRLSLIEQLLATYPTNAADLLYLTDRPTRPTRRTRPTRPL